MKRPLVRFLVFSCLAAAIVGTVLAVAWLIQPAAAPQASSTLVQDGPDLALLPSALERLSWGAVIAGTLVSLILMFVFNLVGIAVGLAQINPERGRDSADAQDIATGSLVWVGITNLVALFIGGWIAAYFAGIPEVVDGLLHGIMVWALTGVITSLLVTMGMGRLMNGLSSLISAGLNLTGSLATGAGQLARGTLATAGNVASGAGTLTAQTLSVLADGVQRSAQMAGSGISNMTDTAIENSPDVQNALHYQDLSAEEIRLEAEQLMRDAGQDPERVRQQAAAAADAVETGVRQAIRHPDRADDILKITLQRVLRRGQDIASDVDRQSLVALLTERANMSEQEATQRVAKWEEQFNKAKEQTSQARDVARERAESFRQQAEARAKEVYEEAQARVAELQREAEARLREAEDQAREAAQATTETFAKLAAGIAVAMIVGAVAAGIGGAIGVPATLPDIDLEENVADVAYVIEMPAVDS